MGFITSRSVAVILLSFVVVVLSGGTMYAVWILTAPLANILRGVVSLFVWIASFAFGSVVFWSLTDRMASRKRN